MTARALVFAIIILIYRGIAAFGQAVVSASAEIVVPITITATAPLAFGSVTRGATFTVPATSASAAAITFSGDAGDQITISIPATATISTTSGGGGSMTVSITRSALRHLKTNNQASSNNLNASSGTATVNLSGDASGDGVNHDGLGQHYLWIGGTLTVPTTQQRGAYSGTFTVSAVYSN